jgi:beta-galactosidase
MKEIKQSFIITALFLLAPATLSGQGGTPLNGFTAEGRAPWRTEFVSYDIRREADTEMLAGSKYYRALDFTATEREGGVVNTYETTIDIPGLWTDRVVFIRDTGRSGRYALIVNGQRAGYNTDTYGGGEWYVTPLLTEGENRIAIKMLSPSSAGSDMERFETPAGRTKLTSLYLFSQPRVRIFDYTVSGYFDEVFKDNIVDLAVVVANDFNMPENVTVGYDIWDPAGERKDYFSAEATISGRGSDTVRLRHKVTGTHRHLYSASNPALYRIVLTLRHGGRPIEYIPLRMSFGLNGWDGSQVLHRGTPIAVKPAEADFPTLIGARDRIRVLKRQGYNTIAVTRPQQKWFYEMAAAEGLWVIDRASVECDPRGGDRTPDGTVANDPSYLGRFLDRQAAMFYRRRNYPNVIGWSIGSESGNGYNMYESYRLLKSLDPSRPVVYGGAGGEWNSDSVDGY